MCNGATYRAGVIGAGRIGLTYDDEIVDMQPPEFFQGDNRHCGLYTILPVNHGQSYLHSEGFELVAASDLNPDKLEEFRQRTGVSALYADYQQMLQREILDVVSVCTRSEQKAEITIAVAEAGVKAIVVEKAMATSMVECDQMIAACERNGVTLFVNHPNRYSPMNREAKNAIQTGQIGDLGAISAFAPSGMLHVGTHTFDMMRYWGGDVVEIEASMPKSDTNQDLPASGIVQFAQGAIGFFDHVHRVCPGYEARGTDGYLHVSGMVGDGWLFRSTPLDPASARKHPMRVQATPLGAEPHTMSMTNRMLAELHDHLDKGTPLVSSAQDGAAALELALACYASQHSGSTIRLPIADRELRVPNR